jgi:hypothetical protein
MDSPFYRLRLYWLSQNIPVPSGVTEDRLCSFGAQFAVTLPQDMREYFMLMDGMGSRSEVDDDFFSFWPLSDMVPVSISECGEIPMTNKDNYFIFADHSIGMPFYAINLREGPNIVRALFLDLMEPQPSVVAMSFSEFVSRYLADEKSRSDLSVGG